jgi:DNA topoisomerase IB
VLKKLSSLKGRRLFSVRDDNGRARPITAREVNAFIAEAGRTDVTAKDFRTFRAYAEALALLTENNGHETERLRKQAIISLPIGRARFSPIRDQSRVRATFIRA